MYFNSKYIFFNGRPFLFFVTTLKENFFWDILYKNKNLRFWNNLNYEWEIQKEVNRNRKTMKNNMERENGYYSSVYIG